MPLDDAEVDTKLDTLALIEAVHAGDLKAVRVLLDHSDTRMVALFAARVVCDVVEDWLLEDEPELFVKMRRHYS